jgi:hypothetical protein
MVTFYDEYNNSLEGGDFSSFRKNLGNKLFMYATPRIIADILKCNIIVPKEPLVRREMFHMGYVNSLLPLESIENRRNIEGEKIKISDSDLFNAKTIDNLINIIGDKPIISHGYFAKYEYIKPYKNEIKRFYSHLIKPKRNNNDLVIMLRDSTQDSRFILNDDYYLDILEKENFDTLYVSYDHIYKHNSLFKKIKKYNPIFLESDIISLFKEITSFNKILASQGTFSFWAAFLSNADKIYWPVTNDGPNSNNPNFIDGINLLVDDEDRYEIINLKKNEK